MTEDTLRRLSVGEACSKILATFFFIGYLPKAPGTWASAVTALVLFFVWPDAWYIQLALILAIYLLGAWTSAVAEHFLGHDSRHIVIDEVAGQMTALFMAPRMFLPFVLGLFLFRLFDITKPQPARSWESFHGGWGVMGDDIAAGAYSAVIMQFFLALLNRWGVSYL